MKYTLRVPAASPFDIPGLESWLERMAARGLYLVKYRDFLCVFVKGEPARVRYRLEPNPRLILEDEAPEKKVALYRELGWDYVCEIPFHLLIFRCADPAAPELHTDPTLLTDKMCQLIQRQRRSTRNLSTFLVVLGGLFLFQVVRRQWSFSPQDLAGTLDTLYTVFAFALLLVTVVIDRRLTPILDRMLRDMKAGITPDCLSIPPNLRRLEVLRGWVAILFFGVLLFRLILQTFLR